MEFGLVSQVRDRCPAQRSSRRDRDCPLNTARGRCLWQAGGTAGENKGARTWRPRLQARPEGEARPRQPLRCWQANCRSGQVGRERREVTLPVGGFGADGMWRGRSDAEVHAARTAGQWPMTANSCQVPSTPFNGWDPRSWRATSEPTTRSRTVLEVRISPGSAAAITRAAMCTAMPPTSPSRSSISPVCSPARICRPMPPSSCWRAAAQPSPRPGPSKVARMPSPVVLMSWPPNSSTRRRARSSWTFRSSRQRRSPAGWPAGWSRRCR